ncbi:MAG: lysophospholipid acyltransferase family protein [Candidatus Kryptoniota bacterium]
MRFELRLKDRFEALILIVVGGFVRLFPISIVHRFASFLGFMAYHLFPFRKEVAFANLRICLPEKTGEEIEQIIKGSYINFATVLLEFLYFPKFNQRRLKNLVEISEGALKMMNKALEKGRGLILMSGHFSNWELNALAVGNALAKKPMVIVHPFHNRFVDKIVNRYRSLLGNVTVPMDASVRAALSTLRGNGVLALLADQSASRESAVSNFFGLEVPTYQGPATFALRTGAVLQMGFLVRESDGRYKFELHEIDYSDLKGTDEEKAVALTQRHVTLLEDYIRRYPDLWLWFHRRFKHLRSFQETFSAIRH